MLIDHDALFEDAVLSQIIEYLRHEQARGRVVWFERSNSGGGGGRDRWVWFYRLYLLGKKPVSKGKADLTGMLDGGRFFALEVKRPQRGRASSEQREYLAAVASGGGIAATVLSFQDAKRELFGEC